MSEIKRLYRDNSNKVIAGICSGLGNYLGVDPILVRLIWLVLIFAFGTGILAYLICWIIIPAGPVLPYQRGEDE